MAKNYVPKCDTDSDQTYTISELKSEYAGGMIQALGKLPTLDRNNSFEDVSVSWDLDKDWLKEQVNTLKRNKLIPELIPPTVPNFPTLPSVPQQGSLPPPPQKPTDPSPPTAPPMKVKPRMEDIRPFDNFKTYRPDDIVSVDNSFYIMTNFIGAAGYHPLGYPAHWKLYTLLGKKKFNPADVKPFDNFKTYAVDDIVKVDNSFYIMTVGIGAAGYHPLGYPAHWKLYTPPGDSTTCSPTLPNSISNFQQGKNWGSITHNGNYKLSFNITPSGPVNNWGTIIHFSSDGGNCCNNGQRSPGIWFYPGTTTFYIILGDDTWGDWGLRPETIGASASELTAPIGQPTSFELVCIDSNIKLTINGKTWNVKQPSKRAAGAFIVYAGDPWHEPPNASVSKLCFVPNYSNATSDDVVPEPEGPDPAQLKYASELQAYNETVARNKKNYNTLLEAYNTKVGGVQSTYQGALNNYRDIYNQIMSAIDSYNEKAKIFNEKNNKYRKYVTDQYCFYNNMLTYADSSLFKSSSDMDVTSNSTIVSSKFNIVQNLKYKLVILKKIGDLTFVDNVKLLTRNIPSVLEGFMGKKAKDTAAEDVNQQYRILTKETEREQKNKRLIEYTVEKNNANTNLLTLFGILNVVALGIIYTVANS